MYKAIRKRARKGRGVVIKENPLALAIQQSYLDEMIAHAKAEYPNESCGIIAGSGGQAVKLYRTRNAERSPVRYVIDPREQLGVMHEMEDKGWDLLAIFHSHTHSPAYPSQTDLQLAYYPDALYVIVSLMCAEPVVKAFRIADGKVEEVALVERVDQHI